VRVVARLIFRRFLELEPLSLEVIVGKLNLAPGLLNLVQLLFRVFLKGKQHIEFLGVRSMQLLQFLVQVEVHLLFELEVVLQLLALLSSLLLQLPQNGGLYFVLERIALRLHRLQLLCVAPDLREEFASDRIKPHVHLLGSDCVFRLQLLQICLHHLKCAHEFFRPSDQLGLKHFKALRDLFEPLLGHGVLAQELWMLERLLTDVPDGLVLDHE